MRRELLTITVIALAGVMMLGGCKKKVATPEAVAMSFTATTDGDGDEGGKTSLASSGAVLWSSDDVINVNGSELTLSSGADSYSGSFSGTPSGSYYVAAYPSSAVITSSTEGSESVTFTLPATQTLTENSFGNGANPMVAKSSSNYLAFRNVCGGIAVRLYGASTGTMDKIVVTGKNGKKLNGTYTVDYKGDTPSATLTTSGNTNVITLESASPITLSASSASPTVFYVMLPAGDYSDGFNVKAYGNNGTIELLDQDFASVPTVERNRLYLLASTQVSGVPAVTTSAATSVASTTATLNGNLTYAGVPTISEKGFVYSSSSSMPTTSDTKVTVTGTATGDYTYNATGLSFGTKYYVRAYATNSVNTVYGDVVEFETPSIPAVTTTSVTAYNNGGAVMGGNVTSNGGETLTARGIVYSTSNSTPTVSGTNCTTQVASGTGTGLYTYNVEGLSAGTKYYVRAYATNSAGTSYGSVENFTTTNETPSTVTTNTGELFTVASGTQVYFAKGNLVKTGASTYAFESTQYTVHTDKPLLFGYPRYYFTWSEIASSNNNPVEFTIGGRTYKTLTNAQWNYLLFGRSTTSGHFYAKAQVNEINGVIILPDNWSDSYYTLSDYNTTDAAFTGNTITSTQWTTLESKGCVFLPVAGYSNGSSVSRTDYGYYGSCTAYTGVTLYFLFFHSGFVRMDRWYFTSGYSVRLVLATE